MIATREVARSALNRIGLGEGRKSRMADDVGKTKTPFESNPRRRGNEQVSGHVYNCINLESFEIA
jgi:hypothetical protein